MEIDRIYQDFLGIIGCMLGLSRDDGEENGNYHLGCWV